MKLMLPIWAITSLYLAVIFTNKDTEREGTHKLETPHGGTDSINMGWITAETNQKLLEYQKPRHSAPTLQQFAHISVILRLVPAPKHAAL